MSRFDHGDLPPELSYVADQLRSHRYEATPLELDQAKTRILKRAGGQRAARGGAMRKRSLLTAVIMFAAIGTGSAAALAVTGVISSVPIISSGSAAPSQPLASASIAMYGHHPSSTSVTCSPGTASPGTTITCKATVTGATHPGGTVSFHSNVGGTFTPMSCTLVLAGGNQASCTVTFSTRHSGSVKIYANYSGDATNSPSHGATVVLITKKNVSSTVVGCAADTVGYTCTATVTGGSHPSGTVNFAANQGGVFVPVSCTLTPIGGNQSRCSVSFHPHHIGANKVYASYSGDADNTPSHTSTSFTVLKPTL